MVKGAILTGPIQARKRSTATERLGH